MVRDYSSIARALMGEWNKTSQPLKERASVLPLGQYEDGSVGLAWPGLLAAPAEGVMNFGQYGYGEEAVPYNSRMAFEGAGGAMTGGLGLGLAGGMADDAVRAAPRAIETGAFRQISDISPELRAKADGLRQTLRDEQMRAAELLKAKGGWQRAYGKQAQDRAASLQARIDEIESGRYVEPQRPVYIDDEPLIDDQQLSLFGDVQKSLPEFDGAPVQAYRGVKDASKLFNYGGSSSLDPSALWASSDPSIANSYAGIRENSAVLPLEFRFKNPLEIDAGGNDFFGVKHDGIAGTEYIAQSARNRGHDGLVIKNIMDPGSLYDEAPPLSTTYAALQRGTVYSPTTGDLLYSNAPTGSSVPLAMNALERAQPALASRDMQQMARSLGYDPQRVRSWASDKINELSRSTWDSDKAEAARLGQLLQELDADPNALAAIRQGERSSVLQSQAQRQQNKTERPLASRDGYQIVRRDDPDVGALNFDILGPDGGSVGSAKMSAAQGQVENPEIGWVGIDEAHQRKGLASWLYDEIERDIGQKLWPSPELISPEIQAFWQKRDPDRLARMLAGTYANGPTGAAIPLGMEGQQDTDPALLEYLRLTGQLPY
jgi:ribosomal protein S18 acetylase RimI-like enzyme